jgi:NTE family protein
MRFFSWLFRKKQKTIKIGLALGSGGAKGFAHLGALKAFEENGIKFDLVAGTSIGSVIGAFVAEGYSSTDIFELIKRVDFGSVASSFALSMNTSAIFEIIDNGLGSLTFEQMKKPFRAVATELETGEEKVFSSGSVAKAVCASSSIPPFFKPVLIDGVSYIDGAYTNSVPADVVRDLGADYVIAIDLSTREKKYSVLKKFIPTYKGGVREPWAKGYANADVILHPDLNEFSSVSVGSGLKMYDIGYQCAMRYVQQIKEEISALSSGKRKKK